MMDRLVRGEAEQHEIDTLEQVTRQVEGIQFVLLVMLLPGLFRG